MLRRQICDHAGHRFLTAIEPSVGSADAGTRTDLAGIGKSRLLSGSYALLLVAILVFASATAYGLSKLSQESALARYESQAALWLVVSFEREYLKLDKLMLRYDARDPELKGEVVLTQFDVLWSRITLMQEGEHSRPLAQVDSYHEAVPVMLEILRRYETGVFDAVPQGLPLPGEFLRDYRAMADAVHRFMIDVHLDRTWADQAREDLLQDSRVALYIALTGTIVSVLMLFVVILLQLRVRHGNLMQTKDALAQSEHDRNALRDEIRRRKQVEQERKRLLKDLAARNDELERYAYTISHDLKSPLYTIQGFTGYLQKDIEQGHKDRALEDLGKIRNAVDTMSRLLEDILSLSKANLAQESRETLALNEIVERALSVLSREIDEHEVEIRVAPDLPLVHAEAQRLTEVFQNLISNAAKFMGDQALPVIEIGARVDGDRVHCFVADNGIGIEPEYQERVFQLFERLDANTQGTGVGLSIVKQVIERHGGSIEIESEGQGSGTRFEFSLPRPPSAEDSDSPAVED